MKTVVSHNLDDGIKRLIHISFLKQSRRKKVDSVEIRDDSVESDGSEMRRTKTESTRGRNKCASFAHHKLCRETAQSSLLNDASIQCHFQFLCPKHLPR